MDGPEGFDYVLLAQAQLGAPIDLVSSIVRTKGDTNSAHVAVETVFTDGEHPFDELTLAGVAVRRHHGPNYVVLELSDSDGQWAAAAFTTGHEGVFHIASGQPRTDKRWDKLERALSARQSVSRCFLNHADFLAIATDLERYSPILVSRLTARKTEDHSSITRGFSQSRPTPQQAVDDIEDQGGVVRTMSMVSDEVSLQIRRIAGATFYVGQPRYFVDNVLRPLAAAAAVRRQLVSNRARQGVDEELHALSIDLSANLFNTREETGLLLDVVSQMPHTEVAVFHRNPYLHFALFDSRDGSNFDIVVTEANSIQIYPGYRASQDAVARVAQALGERFGASSIADPPERERVSIEELIG
ncbi:hypothetical protein [Microbacterium sp. CFBP 8794]|uniref:hypothetical protein n=1 Tax=Microbacterium sp. CFBP 8794 TaxID=2775269 RepID=UPI00177CBFAE|nr:hypothetical protein [Microbacterium sp. CFBP 8794]MBD8477704.1 hypothetical protein [Microbacterium sp. CFBP 8794]